MAGLTLDILADTRQAQKSIKDVSGALDDVGDSLNDVVKDSDKGTERMEKDFRELAREVKRESKTSFESVRRELKDTEQGYDELQRESQSTLKETAASISSVEDGLGAVQEIAANAFAGFGPAGLVAGIGAAAGIGLVGAALTAQNEAAAEAKENLVGMYRDAAEEGRAFLSEAQIIAAATDIYFDDAKRKSAEDAAKRLGVSVSEYIRGLAGDQAALNGILDYGAGRLEELSVIGEDKSKAGQASALAEKKAYEAALIPLERQAQIQKDAESAARGYDAFLEESSQKQRDRINKTADTAQARLAGLVAQKFDVELGVNTTALDKVLDDYRNKKVRITADLVDRLGRAVP